MSQELVTEEALSVKEQRAQPLYADRVRVYPRRVTGTFRRLKWSVLAMLLALYYLLPWVRWERGADAPDQAVLIDMPARRAYFFFIEIWPQEVYYLTGLLILAAVGLFLVTSLAGRVWCGYACPQTVWTDLFMWVERKIEGDRSRRMRLDRGPPTLDKAWRKAAKHASWLAIAFLTGGAWIMYFKDAPTLVQEFFLGRSSASVYFFTGLFTATTYLLAGWAREQVCTYMCPWPRFQAAMFDEDTLIVTYQRWRGEPRGKLKKGAHDPALGDCIDCKACVAVCPTGIDIRDGQQLECISCALCIDACDDIMQKIGRPKHLITYDTEARQAAQEAGRPAPHFKLLRLRTAFYTMLFLGVAFTMRLGLATRSSLDISVLHDRSPLFVVLSDGAIRNGYSIKVLNKTRAPRTFALSLSGLPQASLQVLGQEAEGAGARLAAAPDSVATYQLFLTAPRKGLTASQPVTFRLKDLGGGEEVSYDSVFRGPER